MEKNKFPFPQADDMGKIVRIVNIDDPLILKDKESMQIFLDNISQRQVQYYLSACMYLGIINQSKEFTDIGAYLRELDYIPQTTEIIRILISVPIVGKVFLTERMIGNKMDKSEIFSLLMNETEISNEAVALRRAQTVYKWVKWIDESFKA